MQGIQSRSTDCKIKIWDAAAWCSDECDTTFDEPGYAVLDHLSTVRPQLSAAGQAALE